VQAPVDEDRQVILLVSNKHVFVGKGRVAEITLHKRDLTSPEVRPLLGQTITASQLLDDGFTEHPTADLACLNISSISEPQHNLYFKTLPIEMAATFSEDWLLPFSDVCFIGYPDGRYDTANHLPIVRRGTIATIPQTDFNGIKQLVIDAHVHRGSSGSPVFAMPPPFSGGKPLFLGVLTETMIRGELLQSIATIPGVAVPLTIGLGLVLKVDLVRELIAAAVAKIHIAEPQHTLGGATPT
jgi:Trypsin-like peptidase domain